MALIVFTAEFEKKNENNSSRLIMKKLLHVSGRVTLISFYLRTSAFDR